jgi:hypothetical protein
MVVGRPDRHVLAGGEVLARGNGSNTIYRTRCTRWWVMGTKKGGGAGSTATSGGGRGGALVFPGGAGERGRMERARASWSCGDVVSVPISAGGGAEGDHRR